MKRVFVKFVILNLHEIALAGSRLPCLEVGNNTVAQTVSFLLAGCDVINITSPKLVSAGDGENGCIELVYRVRTTSRHLNPNLAWHHCESYLREHALVDLAMRLERA